MLENQVRKESKDQRPTGKMAIAYDFDGTLSPGNMQEYSFIPELGMSHEDFWEETEHFSKKEDMDHVLAYMHIMLKKVQSQKKSLSRRSLEEHGKKIPLFEGVETWFARINEYAKEKGIVLEHYIISSGLREMIEGTSIRNEFRHIFASRFIYDQNGLALWPALAVNYTNKTQYLFRISRGIMNSYDREKVNQRIDHKSLEILFKNMIYIGDGESDIPCMEVLKIYNGKVILVYPPKYDLKRKKIENLFYEDRRGDFLVSGDYRKDRDLDRVVKRIIDRVSLGIRRKNIDTDLKRYSRNSKMA